MGNNGDSTKEQKSDIETPLFASVGIWVIEVFFAFDRFLAKLCLFLQCSAEQTLQSYDYNANEDGWRSLVFWKEKTSTFLKEVVRNQALSL